jgi:hypothetical protein
MTNLNQWDIKQIIDIVSKGLNSILMSKPDISDEDLQKKAKALLKIYQGVFSELKNPSTNETLDFPVDEAE